MGRHQPFSAKLADCKLIAMEKPDSKNERNANVINPGKAHELERFGFTRKRSLRS